LYDLITTFFISTALSMRIQSVALALLLAGSLFAPLTSNAQSATSDGGVVTIEQKHVDYQSVQRLGQWGLATPVGVIEGESEQIDLKKKPVGNYVLTVTPPAGAQSTIDVYQDGTLVSTSADQRTANGKMVSSGGTLKFVITYSFIFVGNVSIGSTPSGIPFEIKAPAGVILKGRTPAEFPKSVEGTYAAYYILPKSCKPVQPISRKLEANNRINFSMEFNCAALTGGTSSSATSASSTSSTSSTPKPTPKPSTTQSPVRVALSAAASEVTAGGTARYTIAVLNRGESDLSNLSVNFQFDSAVLEIQGARDAVRSGNSLVFPINSLPKDGKWETTFTATVDDSVVNGANISATATVSGDSINDVRASQRSASVSFGVIKVLPQTGVAATDVLMLLAIISAFFLSLMVAGVEVAVRR